MDLKKFYKIIDNELEIIIDKNKDEDSISRHKEDKKAQRKSYAFLIWFIEFYGQSALYKNYITDGHDDNSCDIIFSNKDSFDINYFYVIQSKWLNWNIQKDKNISKIDYDEFRKTLSDFSIILNGSRKDGINTKFNKKYKELIKHLENNGKVKFIYFTLAQYSEKIEPALEGFLKNYAPNITLEIIDIEKIRRDYIEFKYKQIYTGNPLEYNYDPEDNKIELEIERFVNTQYDSENEAKVIYSRRDIFEFEGREKAYIFLLKPKTIYELFKKFKFSLFFKNIRNPIHKSNYNEQIVNTLLNKPGAFWYYNNGVTAITKVIPEIGIHAKNISLQGLQIINGAQTVYSIFQAYNNANQFQRTIMDNDARIMLRLIRSSDEQFNLEITRFTNSQNPLHYRDFYANDDIQLRLQNESFETNIWYEKRRDEFRLDKKTLEELNIEIVSNRDIMPAYIAFHQQNPLRAINDQNLFFVSRKDNSKGLYEEIFNENTKFSDILASFNLLKYLYQFVNKYNTEEMLSDSFGRIFNLFILAIYRPIIIKYLNQKFPDNKKEINISLFINRIFNEDKQEEKIILRKIFPICTYFINEKLPQNNKTLSLNLLDAIISDNFFETVVNEIENNNTIIDDLDYIDIEKFDESRNTLTAN